MYYCHFSDQDQNPDILQAFFLPFHRLEAFKLPNCTNFYVIFFRVYTSAIMHKINNGWKALLCKLSACQTVIS